jgi:thiol-disulfide isomerase/thioredoxin
MKIKLSAVMALAAVFATIAVATMSQDIKSLLTEYNQKREALMKGNAINAADLEALNKATLAKIDFNSITPEEALLISRQHLLREPALRATVAKRMEASLNGNDLSSAYAAMVYLDMTGGRDKAADPARVDVARKLVAYALASDILKGENASATIVSLSSVNIPDDLKTQYLALLDQFDPANAQSVENLATWWGTAKGFIADEAKREATRQRVVNAYREGLAAAKKAGKPEGYVKYFTNTVERLDGAAARGKLIGHQAPAMNFLWSSDPSIKSMESLKGKVVVLDFWATWCGPCVGSFPKVKELKDRYKGYDVEIVGVTSVQGNIIGLEPPVIDTKGDEKKEFSLMKDYMKKKDINWPIVFSKQDVFNPDFGVNGIPHTSVIDPRGKVRFNGLHPSLNHADLIKHIDSLLKEAGKKVPAAH